MESDKKKRDTELFREAMVGVTPLKTPNRIDPVAKKTAAVPTQQEKDNRQALRELLEFDQADDLETGEELLYLKHGYPPRILKRLRRGHYSNRDTIDLHHMDVETARQVLLDFIDHALKRQYGCVRVIHGKGLRSRALPRLKIMTRRVLSKHARVIAFASCRTVDGGTGACNVLLSDRTGGTE